MAAGEIASIVGALVVGAGIGGFTMAAISIGAHADLQDALARARNLLGSLCSAECGYRRAVFENGQHHPATEQSGTLLKTVSDSARRFIGEQPFGTDR